ncbi:MAG: phage capsid protein [Oscillospiraceae bacterium]|nr:phage capsid protein [Oscillospiraceae bacterium]
MAITLAESKVGMTDRIDQAVVDEFRRSSLLLDRMTFDNCVAPGTGGSNLVYGYTQLLTPSTAQFRAINTEYTANEAKRTKKTAELKIFGGAFNVDRVIQNTSGSVDEIAFQLKEKIKAASNAFHYMAVRGNSASAPDQFDGLDVMLTGSSTECKDYVTLDITDPTSEQACRLFMDAVDDFISGLDGMPTMLCGNRLIINRIRSCARRLGYFTNSEDSFGKAVENYNGIPLLDMGEYYNGSSTEYVVPVYDADSNTGLTDLYAVTLGLDGFHGVSPTGDKLIRSYLPDMNQPGALKTGEVEMTAAVVLKNSRKAGVLRGIKVK